MHAFWYVYVHVGVPVILKEPDPVQAVPIGADLILSVHAECHPAPPEYQWFRVSAGKETLLEGHREAVLKFRICTFDDAGEYFCVVGNPLLSGKQEGWRSSIMTIVRVLPPVVEEQPLDHGLGEVQLASYGEEQEEESDGKGRFSYGPGQQQPESQTNSEHGMDHLGNDMQRIGVLLCVRMHACAFCVCFLRMRVYVCVCLRACMCVYSDDQSKHHYISLQLVLYTAVVCNPQYSFLFWSGVGFQRRDYVYVVVY